MKKPMLWIAVFALLNAMHVMDVPTLLAQTAATAAVANTAAGDISGVWQGTLAWEAMGNQPAGKLRIVLKIAKKEGGGWSAVEYSIDQNPTGMNCSGVSLQGTSFSYSIPVIDGKYEGTLSADGNSIAGRWSQGVPLPLKFERATKETAWEIPAPPPPPKQMAADADPSFEVATIKPNPSGGTQMQGLTMNGRNFAVRNGSVGDLISFAYGVQLKQIVNGPPWLNVDRYDIAAVPDKEGAPSADQLRSMMRKLLADRFKLTTHVVVKNLPAYVLTTEGGDGKLTPTQLSGPLPGMGIRTSASGLTLQMVNATTTDFTGFLQMLVLDRPVVDQTGIKGRFDFKVIFTPDDSQFNGHPPKLPEQTGTTESSPNLFDAVQQQLGLKLAAEKTAVNTIVIDHVEQPSPN